MRSAEIRQKFLDYFVSQGHHKVPSSPLVPAQDPTLLFTNAGMVQFKDVFLGNESRSYSRAVSVQKCMRAGGKHNDLDQVGKTARHQTFFEMLGNFSFGDYFKRDAIRFAWQFLTEVLGLDPEILWVTVFETDDEAYELWQEVAGVRPERIVRMGEKDNFWSMGDTGPCGPSSEIFVDRGPEYACSDHCGLGLCDCDRIQEIWNLVFMQYNRDENGVLTPLPKPSIDTGMGLERIAAYLQGVNSNFDTDLLRPLIRHVEHLSHVNYDPGPGGMPFRVIADHIRAITFLLAEGVSFSNSDRGYVMRRILRRAVRFGLLLGFHRPFLHELVPVVGEIMGDAYPEVLVGESLIQQMILDEEERFRVTLDSGMKVLESKLQSVPEGGVLPGEEAFLLYDTYGFPLDLTVDAAEERGITVDQTGFDAAMKEQRERARRARNRRQDAEQLPHLQPNEFVGYHQLTSHDVPVTHLYIGADSVKRLMTGESGWLFTPKTPFYPEGGGQVADTGRIQGPHGVFKVEDVVKFQGAIWHFGTVIEGSLTAGELVTLSVDKQRREGAMRNHTGTHLLHAALRKILGTGVHQTGSLVAPDRLRFDFSYPSPLTLEQKNAIEDLVNGWILEDIPVQVQEMSKDEALNQGALAFFGDKYGEVVRVITVPSASQELCGGTHCQRTGQIGLFAITEETSVGTGSRRIEAVTGINALETFRVQRQALDQLTAQLHSGPEELADKVKALQDVNKALETELAELKRKERYQRGSQLVAEAQTYNGLKIIVHETDANSLEELREVLDGVKSQVSGAVLAAKHGERASLVVYLGKDLVARGLDARALVKTLARRIDGGGGGRVDLAQAGGKDVRGIPSMLEEARHLLSEKLMAAG
ncbi:alanine--tRNA ligase [Sulfobacillus thermosulfidooxidans]|uniref:alanine--tRNA ligase n=1 Tax=Sulfobacillus thermosulfidooxidans TaxID=28034 RepID=UPI00096BCDD0|nr:alanine--tRNA ligase [Sulfobacillus thermosulfidooxidans]OLZ08584.1 alanine--tRNA ligase [Sulfobacillus thermosulfidooxidans]OLZ13187.1 alanine--tRNA ligase [Sulfobacillus thermosulfidooxidans]OLZ21567.1 alanine--tRNA ligase [Sulfobacillus thermosulfidooxidans]